MVDYVAADAIGGHQIAVAVRDQQVKGRVGGEHLPDIVGGACLEARAAATSTAPFPAPADIVLEKGIGHLRLEAEFVAGIIGKGAAIGAGEPVEDWVVAAVVIG